MAATETLLQGATQVTSSLSANYTAGGGTISMATALNDHGGTPVAGPFEILVGRNRPLTERRYFVATPSGSNLTVTPSPGYADNQNFVIGDLIDVISAWETQRRLRAFALLHTHSGTVDGTTLVDAGISASANITLTKLDDGPADDTVSIASTPTTLQGTINRVAAVIKRITGEAAYTTLPAIDLVNTNAHVAAALPSVHGMPANANGALLNNGSGTLSYSAFTTSNPTLVDQGGSRTFTTTLARLLTMGKFVCYVCQITITGVGSAGSLILVTIPVTFNANAGQMLGTFRYDRTAAVTHTGEVNRSSAGNIMSFAVPTVGFLGTGASFATANGDVLWFTVQGEST